MLLAMALTITHLNDDASFLLTLEPLISDSGAKPFHILLDPWITSPFTLIHRKISITTQKNRACISSLLDLPEPDVVIISQSKADHLNPATLLQLPRTGTKTVILAEPSAARVIRGWRHFERGKVVTIPKWEDPRITGRPGVVRIPVPAVHPGEPGEVTVAFIPQRHDLTRLHAAIAITYRPPAVPCPPPVYQPQAALGPSSSSTESGVVSPVAELVLNPAHSVPTTTSLPVPQQSYHSVLSQPVRDRPLSIIYSPHGINYSSLQSYVTSHLVAEAALPLTALLHCFDSVSNPWWLGGKIILGAPAGVEIATRLGARAWFSAHDGDKDVKGVFTGALHTTRFNAEDVLGQLYSQLETAIRETMGSSKSSDTSIMSGKPGRQLTEVRALAIGEEISLTSEGLCRTEDTAPIPRISAKFKNIPPLQSIKSSTIQACPNPRANHGDGRSWLDLESSDEDDIFDQNHNSREKYCDDIEEELPTHSHIMTPLSTTQPQPQARGPSYSSMGIDMPPISPLFSNLQDILHKFS